MDDKKDKLNLFEIVNSELGPVGKSSLFLALAGLIFIASRYILNIV